MIIYEIIIIINMYNFHKYDRRIRNVYSLLKNPEFHGISILWRILFWGDKAWSNGS